MLKINPGLARRCVRLFEAAAHAWERGNNSGDPRELERGDEQCERLRKLAENALQMTGIRVEYPGLYPIFHSEDRTWYFDDLEECAKGAK